MILGAAKNFIGRRRTIVSAVVVMLGAASVRAAEAPPPGTTVAATAASSREGATDLGLPFLWLPIESRTSVVDYVGRWVPGAQLGVGGGLLLRGGREEDTGTFVDGFWMRRLLLPLGMLERADVYTGGYGPEYSDLPGGVVDLSVKSGGDRLGVDAELFYEKGDLRLPAGRLTLSGPIVPGRLYFVVSGQLQADWGPDLKDPEGFYPTAPGVSQGAQDGALKMAWRIAPGQQLQSLTSIGRVWSDNGLAPNVDPDVEPMITEQHYFQGLSWIGRFSSMLTFEARASYQHGSGQLLSHLCHDHPTDCDSIPGIQNLFPRDIRLQNSARFARHGDGDGELSGRAEATLGAGKWLGQRLRLSMRLRASTFDDSENMPGGGYYVFNGTQPYSMTTAYASDPRLGAAQTGWFHGHSSTLRTNTALEDRLRLGERLWITPGLAMITAGAHNDHLDLERLALAPRIGVAWDATGDGKTWLRASSGRRVAADLESLAAHSQGTQAQQTCRWDNDAQMYSKSCILSGGVATLTVGLPCKPDGLASDGTPCRSSPSLPVSWETTLGAARGLGWNTVLAADVVHRSMSGLMKYGGIYEHQPINDWSPSSSEVRRYLGATFSLEKSAGNLRLLVAYTYSHLQIPAIVRSSDYGVDPSPANTRSPPSSLRDAPEDRRHSFRLLARYDVLGFASVACALGHDAGFGDPFVLVALPSRPTHLNLQVRARLRRLIGADVDVYGDALDLISSQMSISDSESFAAAPRSTVVLRLGAQFRY